MENIEWFKSEIAPSLRGYELTYRYFENGDFGSLNQVVFESKSIGGNIDFWGLGWLGVFVFNYDTKQVLINELFEPDQNAYKGDSLRDLHELLLRMKPIL